MTRVSFSIAPFGENGWLARLRGNDMVGVALAANAAADRLRAMAGVTDSVAGIDSLVVRFNPSAADGTAIRAALSQALEQENGVAPEPLEQIEIPVCYGGAFGPDLEILSESLSLKKDEIIAIHAGQTYRVLTVGFAPGFAYLGPLPESLRTRRLATPRAQVPAGSVGVAGAMTGVYPLNSPGGWALIGRTPKRLFTPSAQQPFLFTPGAAVVFRPIDSGELSRLSESAP